MNLWRMTESDGLAGTVEEFVGRPGAWVPAVSFSYLRRSIIRTPYCRPLGTLGKHGRQRTARERRAERRRMLQRVAP